MRSRRPEVGIMCFHGDWPGVFIRGDNSLDFKSCLEDAIRALNRSRFDDRYVFARLSELHDLLDSSNVSSKQHKEAEIQKMKKFEDCLE